MATWDGTSWKVLLQRNVEVPAGDQALERAMGKAKKSNVIKHSCKLMIQLRGRAACSKLHEAADYFLPGCPRDGSLSVMYTHVRGKTRWAVENTIAIRVE